MGALKLSKQETELIEILREWGGKDAYEVTIERRDGAWEISQKPHAGVIKGELPP